MTDFVLWMLFIDVLGLLAFPISFFVFKKAFDRGYTVSKVLGLLLWGFIYWIGNSFKLLTNSRGGAFAALVILLLIAIAFTRKSQFGTIVNWLKENRSQVIFHELLFLAAFLCWAIVRGANPEISGTEKPMEIAFINAIARSPAFPPSDPWLSGYSISYYYFGYIIMAAIMKFLGTTSGTTFNLAVALTFGLVACTSSGILINLLLKKEVHLGIKISPKRLRRILLLSLLAPLFILIVGNAEGFLEVLHSGGVFWEQTADGQFTSEFWTWLDIQDLSKEPPLPLDGIPNRLGGSWWWRASRVLQDYMVNGQSREIIDEFPFFSFLLADLHPHVLAMPFVLIAIYNGFYVFQNPFKKRKGKKKDLFKYFRMPEVWFLSFTTGSLIFINTWDFPIYFGLIALVFIIPFIQERGWSKECLREFLLFTVPFGIASIILYLPFLLGLSSQAGGLQPSLVYRTRFVHFLVMFFPSVSVLTGFLIAKGTRMKSGGKFLRILTGGLVICLFIFSLTLMIPLVSGYIPKVILSVSRLVGSDASALEQTMSIANQGFFSVYGAENSGVLIMESLQRFGKYPLLVIFLLAGLSVILFLLFSKKTPKVVEEKSDIERDHSDQFVCILIVVGILLVLFPEFFYLRDQFGWRMNTIFKFYFQAWILFSLAAAYAVGSIHLMEKKVPRWILSIGSIVVILIGLVYPSFSIFSKTNSFKNIEWSLDGNLFFECQNPDEAEAISYLGELPYGVVAEAVGGSYTGYARVSRLSGFPTVLGWPGHEMQWRGGTEEIGSRESDIKLLYEIADWGSAKMILDQYQIQYVFIGSNERSQYRVQEDKFAGNLSPVFEKNEVVVYAYAQVE